MPGDEPASWQRKFSLAALVAYWIALFVSTHVPRIQPQLPLRHGDKWLHATAFAVLAVLLALAWSLRRPLTWRSFLAMFGLLATYAALDELTQSLVGRNTDSADWLADVTGIAGGLAVFLIARTLWHRRVAARYLASADDSRTD